MHTQVQHIKELKAQAEAIQQELLDAKAHAFEEQVSCVDAVVHCLSKSCRSA